MPKLTKAQKMDLKGWTKETFRRNYEYFDNNQLYVIKNVPCTINKDDEETVVYSAQVTGKVVALIDLMKTKKINQTELDYQDFLKNW